mgnify:CR=1 FL=1
MDTQETKIYIAFLIAAAILGVFLIFFIVTIIQHQRKNQALQKEKNNAEITTLEKERTRIAADLHDDLGPMLSTVKLLINNVDLDTVEDKLTLDKASEYIDSVLLQPAWVDRQRFAEFRIIEVDPGEAHAANVLRIDDALIMPASFPRTRQRLLDAGFKVIAVDVSELQKAEGAVTCCSLVFLADP